MKGKMGERPELPVMIGVRHEAVGSLRVYHLSHLPNSQHEINTAEYTRNPLVLRVKTIIFKLIKMKL
jgi:hypothetical protein